MISPRWPQSCQHGFSAGFQENGINPYIWCVVGAVLGWASGLLMASGGRIVLIENVLVGVFGAYIGGDFVASMLNGGVVNDIDFSLRSLGLAIAGAVLMLLALCLMRRMVGPMKPSKAPRRRD